MALHLISNCGTSPLSGASLATLPPLGPELLATAGGRVPAIHILMYLGAIILLAMGLAIAAVWLRRRLMADAHPDRNSGFTLSDLRSLRASGELSEEQYQAARTAVLASSLGQTGMALPNAAGSEPALRASGIPEPDTALPHTESPEKMETVDPEAPSTTPDSDNPPREV